MIEMTDQVLQEIETYASLMFTKKEMAIILEVDEKELCELIEDVGSLPWKHFNRGRYKREIEIRKSIFELAGNGSSPAQSFAVKIIENAKMEDL